MLDWMLPVAKILDQLLAWVDAKLMTCFNVVISAIVRSLLVVPDVTGLPQVQALTGRSTWVVDTVFLLMFVAGGVMIMVAGGDERARYTVKDLGPRLVVGFIAAHFSQLLCGQAIAVANGLTIALSKTDHDDTDALSAVDTRVHNAAKAGLPPMLFVALIAIITCLAAAMLFAMLVRFATLLVLTAAAPLALACHALPQTDALARLWWRGYAGCLATPVLQAMTLQAGQWMLQNPEHLLPINGLPASVGAMINLFVVMVMFWYTAKIPGLVARLASQGGRNTSFLGMVVRVVVVQQITRAVRLPGLGRGARMVTR
jgi:hypothetical protein